MAVTTAAVVGIAATAASVGMSFKQASDQKKLQKEAQRDAEKAMNDARAMIDQAEKRLDINYYDKLAVNKEPYERAREQFTSTAAQAIEAGAESERGAAATAGRTLMAQNLAQEGVRSEMSKEIQNIEMIKADEEARLRDMKTRLDMERANIDKGEAEGAQLAARDAQQAAAAATQQAFQGLTSLGQQAMQAAPLYGSDVGAQKAALGNTTLTPEQFAQIGNVPQIGGIGAPGADGFTNLDLTTVSQMSDPQYRKFMRQLTPQQRQSLFTNPDYIQNYNPFQPF